MIFLQDNFVFPPFIKIHFDGKIRKQFGQKSDFLALCVTGKGLEKEKVLGDIPIPTGSGHNMSMAVVSLLEKWKLPKDAVIAFCFDTTTSNTGVNNG